MATIVHDDVQTKIVSGKTIFDYADQLSVQVPTSCYRTGHCHECVVEIRRGMKALEPLTEKESFLNDNYRLACQAKIIRDDVDVEFSPLRRTPKILTVGVEKPIALEPMVIRRSGDVFYDGDRVDDYRGHIYGLAIDLGTTTVVIELLDLESGETVSVTSFENPQRFGGSDIMHRISYDGTDSKGELQRAICNAINHEIVELGKRFGFVRQEIYEIVVAGNSTMRDLLFKLDVQGIGQKPYKSQIEHEYLDGKRSTTALVENARRLGLRANLRTKIYGMPLIASHVGADMAADVLAVELDPNADEIVMIVDVGTNTEVLIGGRGRMLSASCPAGPAFEGGLVKFGMPGYEGAIESFSLANNGTTEFNYSTIGGLPPQGICGSGLVDLLAELRRHGRMSEKGVFENRKQFEMMLIEEHDITFSREDASNLAQAKAANYCGQFIAMRAFGIDPDEISNLYLAGGFANYIDVHNAVDIGFLAPVPLDRIVKVGNAAVQGAREVLLNRSRRKHLEHLVTEIKHIELETTPDFFEVFVEGCQFKPMPTRLANGDVEVEK